MIIWLTNDCVEAHISYQLHLLDLDWIRKICENWSMKKIVVFFFIPAGFLFSFFAVL